ncbi:protein NLRC5 [Mantella aurantiaca]
MSDMENAILQLEEILRPDVAFLVEQVQRFLPDADLSHILQMTDDRGKVSAIIQLLRKFHPATWQKIMENLCINSKLPMAVEVALMSLDAGSAETSWDASFSNEDVKQRRIQVSATRYAAQIQRSIVKKYGFRDHGDPRSSCNPMFVEPIIRIIKVRQRSRADQTSEASSTEEIKNLFQRTSLTATHVILLIGMPGTGKTMTTHRICYQWARGQFSQHTLTFLFEFRQLNRISRCFTLKELFFNLYLMPEINLEEVYEFVIKNPQKVLIIFDGLDEFGGQFPASPPNFTLDVDQMASISNLFTCLFYGKVLQGCTIIVTCRSKLFNSLPLDYFNHIAEVLGFNEEKVGQYVDDFFSIDTLKEKVLLYLKVNSKVMHLCFVPALCHIACVCLEHLLSTSAQSGLPQTITQFYIEMLKIFIQKRQTSQTDEATLLRTLKVLILELAHLAHKGLDENKTVFYSGEISEEIKNFAPSHGLLSVFEVKKFEDSTDLGYSFVHLSSQEFFAALYLIIDGTVTPSSLHKRLNLKSKWNIKYKTKEELTDQFHIFLSGLSSKDCQPFLHELSEPSENLIQKKHETILESLAKLAETQLTGPKLIELCHCIYETQDQKLAKCVGKDLAHKYNLKNFRITPVDMAAVMFVVKHGSCLVSLDFSGCAMELECLKILGSFENVESLSFKSQKYGGTFAQALSKELASMKYLKRIRLTAACLTPEVIEDLKKSFPCCPALQEINLQGNHLKRKDMEMLLNLFSEMEQLKNLDLSQSELNVTDVLSLVKSSVTHRSIRDIQITGDIPTAIFSTVYCNSQSCSSPPFKKARYESTEKNEISLSLKSCNFISKNTTRLIGILTKLHLSYLNLSGNPLGDAGCKKLIKALPKLHIAGKLNLSNTGISEEGVLHLISSMQSCPHIKKILVSNIKQRAVLDFITAINDDGQREIRINGFTFHQKQFEKLCKILQQCSQLTHLDLSENHLENAAISQLTQVLPHLKSLHLANLSGNNISLGGILSLTEVLSAVEKLTDVNISFGNHQKAMLIFHESKREKTFLTKDESRAPPRPLKSFSLTEYRMTSQKLQRILRILIKCPDLTQINLSMNALSYKMIANLLKYLPQLPNLILLNISKSDLSPNCVLLLATSINLCHRITEVDIRSADNIYIHLQTQPIADKVTCRLNSCRIGKNDVAPLMKELMQHPNLLQVSMCMNHLSEDGILVLLAFLSSCTRVMHITACLNPTETIHIVFSSCGGSPRTIRLAGCRFQAEHVKKICNFVQSCKMVTKLKLKRNNISPHGVNDVVLAMSQIPHESILSIEEPWIEGEHFISLVLKITQPPASIKALSVLKNKVTIDFHGCTEHQDSSFPGLKSLRFNLYAEEMQNLSFLHTTLTVHGSHLTELDVSHNSLGDIGIKAVSGFLTSMPSLLTLKLARVHMSHNGVASLADSIKFCKSIVNITLSGNDIGEKGALTIKDLLTQKRSFKAINVSECFVGTTDGGRQFLSELSRCPELQEINLMSMSLDDVALLTFSQGLAHMSSMKILMLGKNKITAKGIQHLTDNLVQCPEMEALDLSCNSIEDAGAHRLAAVLPRLKKLKKISLSQTNMSSLGGLTLIKAIGQCQLMEDITLQSCGLGDVPGNQLVDALVSCSKIENISFSENKFEEQSFLKFVEGLQHFIFLRKIHLKVCEVTDIACKSLAKALGCSKNVEEIILSWNIIGDEGSCAFASVFKQMGNLKTLDLEQNQIKDEGAEAMAQALGVCSYIKKIRLWGNPISREKQEKLKKQDPRLNFSI